MFLQLPLQQERGTDIVVEERMTSCFQLVSKAKLTK